jgi:type IV secretion system protein VirB10
VLKTRIVTEYKGLAMCQATKDVYSADGGQVLVDRGSTLFGEQRVAIQQGQSRVFINWTDIETPHGINVRINSLGTDALGAAGAEAWIDKHTAERFGGAIMLSFIQDMFQTLANRNQSTIVYNNSQQATTDMAAKALDNSINIPPTGHINQGTLMNVLVARDVDMAQIYKDPANNAPTEQSFHP